MIADGWRPDVVAVLHAAFPVEVCALILGQDRIVVGQSRTDKLPVDEVCAVENLQAGEAGEARRGHVIVIPDTADIRVRIVSVDNRIAVFPSADIGYRGLRYSAQYLPRPASVLVYLELALKDPRIGPFHY